MIDAKRIQGVEEYVQVGKHLADENDGEYYLALCKSDVEWCFYVLNDPHGTLAYFCRHPTFRQLQDEVRKVVDGGGTPWRYPRILEHLPALGEEFPLQKDRWYFFEVYPRDLKVPKYRFVGKLVAHKDDETVLTDQTHHLYWVRIAHFHVNIDFVTVETEWAESDFLLFTNRGNVVFVKQLPRLPKSAALIPSRSSTHSSTCNRRGRPLRLISDNKNAAASQTNKAVESQFSPDSPKAP